VSNGTFVIGAAVDTGNAVTEENEGNNATSSGLAVYPPEDKLAAAGLSFSPSQPLPGTPVTLTATVRNGDGVANGFEYAFGTNAPAAGPLLTVRMANGRPVVETPEPDAAAAPYVDVRVLGSTNLVDWDLPVCPAADTTGKPADRAWHEPDGVRPERAFFKLEAELK